MAAVVKCADVAVLFAMGRESQGFRRLCPGTQRFAGVPCSACYCGSSGLSVLVMETGIGAHATQQALDWLFSKPKLDQLPYEPTLVLFAGFAGALVDDLQVGDVVVATDVLDLGGKRWPTTWPGQLATGPAMRRGVILSSPTLIGTPGEKHALGQKHVALAVDMESAAFAAACSKQVIPFGCLRVISDDVDTSLSPQLVDLLAGGRVSGWRVLTVLFRRPALLNEFMRLSRDTRLASDQLGKALKEVLTPTTM